MQALLELELRHQKIEESNKSLTKKILPPKYFFNDNVVEEIIEDENEFVEQIIETVEVDPYKEQIDELKSKLFEIENSIPEEVDLSEIIDYVNSLKEKIDNLPKPKDYSGDINLLRSDLIRIENSIPIPEVFDPSELYKNISFLKDKIDEVKSEIPIVPEQVFYDDELDELKNIIEGIRNNIPTVPEVKYYDDELNSILDAIEQVREEIPELPEIKYYDEQISLIENRLSEIQESIPVVPEIKYYDEQISLIENRLSEIQESIPVVPDVKYYDEDVETLKNEIDNVKNSIPTVPEVKYYDEDVETLKNEIDNVKNSIPTVPEVKYYDKDISSLNGEIKELHDKLSSIKIPNEDIYFDKVKSLYSSFEEKNKKLLEKINYLEEVFDKFNDKTILQEDLAEPPTIENKDPLTPLDQNFVTLDQLQQHYKLFINRIQQQLASIGGGGETRLEFLDDVDRNTAKTNGYVLQYDSSVGKFIGTSYSAGIGTDTSINTTGIITASSFHGDGSGLTGIVATGTGIGIKDNNSFVGTATTIDFGNDLDVTFASGVASINVSIPLSAITDVDTSNLTGISTDYLMVYDPGIPGFKFVDPKTYFGINNDFNPSPDIDDYGEY